MKRILSFILSACLFALLFAGCTKIPEKPKFEDATTAPSDKKVTTTSSAPEEPMTVKLSVSKGPAACGMVYLFESIDNKNSLGDYEYEIVEDSAAAADKVAAGECQIAAVNTEDALRLYKTAKDKVQIIAISSFSNFYFVELGEVTLLKNVNTLTGKFYVPNGSILEPVMTAIFNSLENEDLTITTQFDRDALMGLVEKNRVMHAALPEPYATQAATKSTNEHVGVDVSDLWENLVRDTDYADSKICGTCIVANKDFLNTHPKATAYFLKEFKASVKNVNSQTTAPDLLVNYKLAEDAEQAKALIGSSSIVCKTKDDMKDIFVGFMKVLSENGAAVDVPDVNFFYMKSY